MYYDMILQKDEHIIFFFCSFTMATANHHGSGKPFLLLVVFLFFFSSSFFSSSRRLSFLLLLLFFAFFSSSSLFFVFLSPSARAVLLRILKSFYSSPCYLNWFIIILTKCSWYNLQCCIQSNYRSLKQVNFPIDFFHISY